MFIVVAFGNGVESFAATVRMDRVLDVVVRYAGAGWQSWSDASCVFDVWADAKDFQASLV